MCRSQRLASDSRSRRSRTGAFPHRFTPKPAPTPAVEAMSQAPPHTGKIPRTGPASEVQSSVGGIKAPGAFFAYPPITPPPITPPPAARRAAHALRPTRPLRHARRVLPTSRCAFPCRCPAQPVERVPLGGRRPIASSRWAQRTDNRGASPVASTRQGPSPGAARVCCRATPPPPRGPLAPPSVRRRKARRREPIAVWDIRRETMTGPA